MSNVFYCQFSLLVETHSGVATGDCGLFAQGGAHLLRVIPIRQLFVIQCCELRVESTAAHLRTEATVTTAELAGTAFYQDGLADSNIFRARYKHVHL